MVDDVTQTLVVIWFCQFISLSFAILTSACSQEEKLIGKSDKCRQMITPFQNRKGNELFVATSTNPLTVELYDVSV